MSNPAANHYQEDKCQKFIEALQECCAKYGPNESIVCSGMQAKKKASPPTDSLDGS